MTVRTIGLTGATGYLGGAIAAALEKHGHEVLELGRSPSGQNRRFARFVLGERPDSSELERAEGFVHAAWDLQETGQGSWERNVQGSMKLFDKVDGRQCIFISSMSAYEGTRQAYGIMKLAVEGAALTRGITVVRPGLVWGPEPGGMVGALAKASRLLVVPNIAPRALQFASHEDDVAHGVVRLLASSSPPRVPLGFCAPEPIPFHQLLVAVRRHPRAVQVPLPWPALYGGLRLGERLGLSLPFRSDSLQGLVRPAPNVPNAAAVASLGITFRSFDASFLSGLLP